MRGMGAMQCQRMPGGPGAACDGALVYCAPHISGRNSMDILYVLAAALLLVITLGLVAGCAALESRK